MTRKQRKTKTAAAQIRLSSQILMTMKPQGEREAQGLENSKDGNQTNHSEPGEDEGKGECDQDEEKKKRRKPNTCLPQSN